MSCIGCSKTKPVLNCINDLLIGVLEAETEYIIYFKNSSNGKIHSVAGTSDKDGILLITLNFTPNASVTYEVWAVYSDFENIEDKQTILIDGIEVECLYVTFQRVYGTDNVTITATQQTLELA